MSGKLKGHAICPNCGKETDFILKRGEALVWCRGCRRYFRVYLDTAPAAGSDRGSVDASREADTN